MTFRERLQAWRYNFVPDHLIGEILTKRWTDNAIPFLALVITVASFRHADPGLLQALLAAGIRPASSASSRIVVTGLTVVMLGGGIDLVGRLDLRAVGLRRRLDLLHPRAAGLGRPCRVARAPASSAARSTAT